MDRSLISHLLHPTKSMFLIFTVFMLIQASRGSDINSNMNERYTDDIIATYRQICFQEHGDECDLNHDYSLEGERPKISELLIAFNSYDT
jgi:hypothetical protein